MKSVRVPGRAAGWWALDEIAEGVVVSLAGPLARDGSFHPIRTPSAAARRRLRPSSLAPLSLRTRYRQSSSHHRTREPPPSFSYSYWQRFLPVLERVTAFLTGLAGPLKMSSRETENERRGSSFCSLSRSRFFGGKE